MRRRVVLAAGAVCLLFVAAVGVYVFGDAPGPPAGDDAPRTTAFPPGLTADGVTNASALVDAHQEVLADTAHAYTRAVRVTHPNGTRVANWTQSFTFGADDRTAYVVQTAASTTDAISRADHYEVWTNRSVTVGSYRNHGDTQYLRVSFPYFFAVENRLRSVFLALDTTLDEQSLGAPFTVHATAVVRPDLVASTRALADPRNVTFTAAVTRNGGVQSYDLTYDATLDGQPVHVVERYELTDVDVDVPKPDWVDEAIRRTDG